MQRNSLLILSAVALSLIAAGCEAPNELVNFFNAKIAPKVGFKLQQITKATKSNDTASGEADALSPDHRALNAGVIKEMFKSVLTRELRNDEELGKYMNVLDQGGHFEGIYNGLVYSTEYKEKETGVAPVPALKMYAELMANIMLDQKYDPLKIQKPEAQPDVPTADKGDIVPPQPTDTERQLLTAQYEREGITKPLFTLKRRLGEETLRAIDLKKEYKEKLATWYGRFTTRLNKKNVDFGIAQRNRADEYYHYKWALDADEDRLKWECLNRIHVLMDSTTQAK